SITGGGMFSVVRNPAQNVKLVIPTSSTFPPTGGTIISAVADSPIGLLPFSEESGIRYRVGVRIVDTSAMANLNVGLAYDPTSRNTGLWGGGSPLLLGTYVDGYDLAAQSIFPWAPVNSAPAQGVYDAFNAMRNGQALGINTPAGWEKLLYSSDAVPQNPPASLFDLSDELELRSYGAVGTNALPRPATATISAAAPSWSFTLGGA